MHNVHRIAFTILIQKFWLQMLFLSDLSRPLCLTSSNQTIDARNRYKYSNSLIHEPTSTLLRYSTVHTYTSVRSDPRQAARRCCCYCCYCCPLHCFRCCCDAPVAVATLMRKNRLVRGALRGWKLRNEFISFLLTIRPVVSQKKSASIYLLIF